MNQRRVLVGLIGANIMDSLSPALHADAFAAAGIDGYDHLMDIDRLSERSLVHLLDLRQTPFARSMSGGGPDTIRTCDLCLRRAALYPAELRVLCRRSP
jgi:Shikimate dehydrogenase substrate binding domain